MKIRRKKKQKGTKTHTRKGNPRMPKGVTQKVRKAGPKSPPHRFKKGNPGRIPGTKNQVPKDVKVSIKAVMEEVAAEEGKTIRQALMGGIKGGPRNADRYIKLMAEYIDGKPTDNLNINRFDEDELAQAKARLDRKMSTILKAVLAKRATHVEPEPEGSG